ncbi:MAG: hypothetical protein H6Q30_2718 [Bacteroidetes bacterium]|jgi:hypothetical protein|nr:hypothetical protein [Bacteroidota bacterium]
MKKRRMTLSRVLASAMTDKALMRALRKGAKETNALLARRGFALSARDQRTLITLTPAPKPKPLPPPPPAWEPVFTVVKAILTELDERIAKLEKNGGKRSS